MEGKLMYSESVQQMEQLRLHLCHFRMGAAFDCCVIERPAPRLMNNMTIALDSDDWALGASASAGLLSSRWPHAEYQAEYPLQPQWLSPDC